jgi:prepilin-type N-terminal cleavage/methylation domain-containing protein
MKRQVGKRGHSLIELLISLGIVAVIISMTTGLYIQMFNHYQKVAADVDAQSDARFAMGRATQALRQATTSPINPPGPPVIFPTPGAGSTPSSATSVQFYDVRSMPADADYNNATYQIVTIALTATPPPGDLYPDLDVTTTDMSGNQLGVTTIGRNVESFTVYPVTDSIFDIQITTRPGSGISQGGQVEQPFTLNSRVYISYYQ